MSRIIIMLFFGLIFLSCSEHKNEKNNLNEVKKLKLENDSLKTILKNGNQMRLEINVIVSDAKEAGAYYKEVLNAEIISQTDNERGMNETMLKLGSVEVRVLDENKDMGMFAPAQIGGQSVGINLFVDDIDTFFNNAIKQGCNVLSPVTEFPEIPAKNAVFSDKFNHLWVVNQQYE